MQNFKSKFLQELNWRGFISQITHIQELDELMFSAEESKKGVSAYIGFDCTADSLHAGSLIQIMILRLLKTHGHNPIVLLGGGTTKIGDPSGKDEARGFLDEAKIAENLSGIRATIEKFKPKNGGENWFEIVNNDDWLKNLNYLEFLRDVGRHFSVNRMLTFDSVKTRLERDQPFSFLEFNYMILQAYDFYVLNRDYDCRLQIGGSDQWGNIVNGVELIRRTYSAEIVEELHKKGKKGDWTDTNKYKKSQAFGLTSPLLTTSDGKKMGKTADGAIWLTAEKFSPFEYFQYFRNATDEDTIKFLKLFTDLKREEIAEFEKLQGAEINKAKEILAFEATKICHGEKAANEVLQKAREIFVAKNTQAFEEFKIALDGEKKLVEIIKEIGACESNKEARRLIEGRAVKINNEIIEDINFVIQDNKNFDLQVGKKKFYKIAILG